MKNFTATVFSSMLVCLLLVISCKKEPQTVVVQPDTCRGTFQIITQGYTTDSVHVYFPTVFTPNGDGLNDSFAAIGAGMTQLELSITRNNEPVFQSTQAGQSWGGLHNGNPADRVYSFTAKLLTRHNETLEVVGKLEVRGSNSAYIMANCSNCLFSDQFDSVRGAIMPTQENLSFCQ